MNRETLQKKVADLKLMWQLFVFLTMAAMLLTACGKASPVYPGAKSAKSITGILAVDDCRGSDPLLIGRPGETVKINPKTYSTPDPLGTVNAWYERKLTDWDKLAAPCKNGVSYVFPKGCRYAPGQCDIQLYLLGKDSGGTLIVFITR